MKNLFTDMKKSVNAFNIYQKIATAILILAVPCSIALGVSAISQYNQSKQAGGGFSEIITSIVSPSKKPDSLSSAPSLAPIKVSLKPSSVEEDLEVQIVNENGELITGVEFRLVVKGAKNGYNKTWAVSDGFLKLTKLSGGDYIVTIKDRDGYIMPEELKCKVEKKVAYEKVDVSDKLVDDSKVDSSKEDAGFGGGSPSTTPPPKVSDTVEFVESTTKVQDKVFEKITYKYKPILLADGTIKTSGGASSGLFPELDTKGYLTGAYKLENKNSASGNSLANSVGAASLQLSLKGFSLKNLSLTEGGAVSSQKSLEDTTTETTPEPTATATPEPTATATPEPTATATPEPTATAKPSPTATAKPSPTATAKPSPSPTVTTPVCPSHSPSKVDVPIFDKDGKPLKDDLGNPILSVEAFETKTSETKKVTVYFGWQTIDGKKYFFNKNGDKVTGTQVIQGITYYFDKDGAMGSRIGVDVSKYQGNIDWAAVKASGIEFAIIRAGYRGYGSGVLVEDPYFRSNIKNATAAGLKVGVYFFTQAITSQEAVEEASMVLDAVKGYNLAYPIFFDTEYSTSSKTGRADGLSKNHRTSVAKAFCETVRNAGYKAGVYASKSWFYNQLEYSQVAPYSIWVAHYASATDFVHRYDIWQYTGSGTCAGIGGAVDLNIGYSAY
ncbi:MAG: GH25 family lysozyme [Oscillospiraceae bacterium]